MKRNSAAFSLMELLVVIAIIAILMSFLFPTFQKARESAKQTQCVSNMKQIGLSLSLYAQDEDDFLPDAKTWVETLKPYYKNASLLTCPSDSVKNRASETSYGLNADLAGIKDGDSYEVEPVMLTGLSDPSQTIAAVELSPEAKDQSYTLPSKWKADSGWDDTKKGPKSLDIKRHIDKSVYLFADSHAKAHVFSDTYTDENNNWYKANKE